jgi:hypothetical protein
VEKPCLAAEQGDQIGRIFAYWWLVYCLSNTTEVTQILVLTFPWKKICFNFDKKRLGEILTNTSGHPAAERLYPNLIGGDSSPKLPLPNRILLNGK